MIFPVIGKIAALLISPKILLSIVKPIIGTVASIIVIIGMVGLIVTATPKPIKMKIGEMFAPITQPLNIAIAVAAGFVGILAVRE